VTAGVINFLKVIDVAHDYAERVPGPAPATNFDLQQVEDGAAIRKAGEPVVGGSKLQLILGMKQRRLKIENPFAGPNPGPQFINVKRLGQVVVSAGFEAGDHVLLVVFGSQQ